MHDPMTVVFDIRRPWPQRAHFPQGKPDRRWDFGRIRVIPGSPRDEEARRRGVHPVPWWRPSSWSAFWVLAGRRYYWPSLVTVWHVDPERFGDDSSCRTANYTHRQEFPPDPPEAWHNARNWSHRYRVQRETPWLDRVVPWRWHLWHWHIQVHPVQQFKRWAFSRCSKCGGRFRWGYSPVSGSWHGTGPLWFRSERNTYHSECDDSVKQVRSDA